MSDGSPAGARALNPRQLAQAAGIVMLAYVASGALGIVRQAAIGAAFGADVELDAFVAAQRVPETLFVLVAGGALGSAFIPVLAGFLAKSDEASARRLTDAVITLLAIVSGLLALGAAIFAGPIMRQALLRGADPETQALAIELMRIMLLTVVIFAISGLFMGLLNAHQHFLGPALAPSAYNLGLIFGALALARGGNVHGLAWGSVIGAALHLLVQVPALARIGFRWAPLPNWRVPGVGEVLRLMGPRVLGLGIVQVNFWVSTALASGMMAGSVAALNNAFILMFTVIGVLGQSIGTAVFPTLSTLSALRNTDELRRTLGRALSSVLFLSIPAGLGLAVISEPVVALVYQRGEWTATDTAGTAWALLFFSIGLAGHTVLEILVRAFYALHDTLTPVKVGTLTMLLNIVLALALIRVFGYPDGTNFARGPFGGLALAMSIATAIESASLWIILRRRIGGLDERRVLSGAARTLAASGAMALVAWAFLASLPDLSAAVRVIGAAALGAGVFWGAALLLGVDEARALPQMVLARVRRG